MNTKTVLFLIVAIMITGCSADLTQLKPQLVSEWFPYIRDGKTSKEEILSRLSEPDNRYERGRIFTYMLCPRLGETHPTNEKSCYSKHTNTLILVFGPDDLVERHSVVRME
jgi:hypothetical protein